MSGALYRLEGGTLVGGASESTAPTDWHPVFGAAVTAYPHTSHTQAQEFAAHQAACGPMGIHRQYDGAPGMPSSWSATAAGATVYTGWEDRWTWTSVKPNVTNVISGALDGVIAAWLASIPAAKPGIKRMITCWHEPEAKVPGTFSADQWKACVYHFGELVRDAGRSDLLYGPIFMSKFTLATVQTLWDSPAAGDLNDVIDFVGWDPYNEDSSNTPKTYGTAQAGMAGMEYYFTDLTVWTQQHAPGKPVAIGETSFQPDEANLSRRVDFIAALEQFAIEQRYLAVCWFDASITTPWWLRVYEATRGNDTTLTADTASIDAWADVYTRHPLTYQGAAP